MDQRLRRWWLAAWGSSQCHSAAWALSVGRSRMQVGNGGWFAWRVTLLSTVEGEQRWERSAATPTKNTVIVIDIDVARLMTHGTDVRGVTDAWQTSGWSFEDDGRRAE